MSTSFSRRRFLTRSLQAGAVAGLADFGFLKGLPPLTAAEARVNPKTVQLGPDIEPLVRLIEDTERDKVLERVADRVRHGTGYQDLLSAVFLAGVRGIKPRPVGFQFHAVLVINSAHLASLAAADHDRWLPLFWAVDNFKASQATNREKNGGWMLPPPEEGKLPSPSQARQAFIRAMDDWDVEGTDRAITALGRSAGADEVMELFYRYGARDFRDIGHKAIYVANGYRTLQTIGWRHAEPFLRSLAFALLEHEGGNPARRNAEPDRPGRENLERLRDIGPLAKATRHDPAAGAELLATLRTASPREGSDKVIELLKKGISPDCVWDGLFLTAGELLMRQPGIVGIHCVTSANALHYAYQMTVSDETRRLMMLQTAAFLTMFREFMLARGQLADLRLDDLPKEEVKGDTAAVVQEIFHDVSKDRLLAARKTYALVQSRPEAVPALSAVARRLIFAKGRDSHDYKFSSAALEDYFHLTPRWRANYAAASMFNLHGTGDRDNNLIRRTRAALA